MINRGSGIHRIIAVLTLFFCTILIVHCSFDDPQTEQATSSKEPQKAAQNTPELADAMGQLQYYTHKYALALEAENHELATFYFHEVRASTDWIKENIPGYEGYEIARFMRVFLDPTIEPVETALGNRNWEEARQNTIDMINACNSCHNATSHGFVKVTPGFDDNPYNQDFSGEE